MNALIFPVWGICGPTQRSTIGPQRYTVVDVPSGILDSMICFLYLLYCIRVSRTMTLVAERTHGKHLEQGLFRDYEPFKFLFFLYGALWNLFQRWVIRVADGSVENISLHQPRKYWAISPALDSHLVEESIVRRGTNTQVAPIMSLCSLSEDMSRRMPEHAFSYEIHESVHSNTFGDMTDLPGVRNQVARVCKMPLKVSLNPRHHH